ncbi:MAG TPA: ornithine carbamoyltransferase [Planctomycetaceae bacterium]|nr:ornithine carbamoyltransferase [Planctomycetaceae bacterium]
MRHLLTLNDISSRELSQVLTLSTRIKAEVKKGIRRPRLAAKTLAMIFEKQSLRTRVSFEAGMVQLGGHAMFLGAEAGFGKRESMSDFSRVLSSMVDCIAIRAMRHATAVALAQYSRCPVINALTDESHPCQALADMLTIKERFGKLQGLKLAYVGDSNNVTASLVQASAKLGLEIAIASPKGYCFGETQLAALVGDSPANGFLLEQTTDPGLAVQGAHAVYTDVWVSMGQEKEEAKRKKAFAAYQVNSKLMKAARKDAIFLHCLPARRGLEVSDEVMDSPQSAIIEQAENRMHAQKGLLVWLLGTA